MYKLLSAVFSRIMGGGVTPIEDLQSRLFAHTKPGNGAIVGSGLPHPQHKLLSPFFGGGGVGYSVLFGVWGLFGSFAPMFGWCKCSFVFWLCGSRRTWLCLGFDVVMGFVSWLVAGMPWSGPPDPVVQCHAAHKTNL